MSGEQADSVRIEGPGDGPEYHEFAARLQALAPRKLSAQTSRALYAHYRVLSRWNDRSSLVGPGTLGQLLERHYGESLAALTELPSEVGTLVDVGSGAGFPGFVLAACLPQARSVLVESRQRKWAFLRSAARSAGLPVDCLLARVGGTLPAGFPDTVDLLTLRATKLSETAWAALIERLAPSGRVLVWAGREVPPLSPPLHCVGETALPGARWRRILTFAPGGSSLNNPG